MSVTVVVLGDACTGKTDIVTRLSGKQPSSRYSPSIGAEVTSTAYCFANGQRCDLTLWDIPGNERFLSAHGTPLMAADVCLLVFDSTSTETMEHMSLWHDEYLQSSVTGYAPAAIVVAANKVDLQNRMDVSSAAGWCADEVVDPALWLKDVVGDETSAPPLVEVSAKENIGFDRLRDVICRRG